MSGSSRRTFLARSLALGIGASSLGSLAASCTDADGTGSEQKPIVPKSAASTKRFKGRIVVATKQNPSAQARQALTRAYRRQQPGVEIVWDTRDYTDSAAYTAWLDSQLSSGPIRPDIVSGSYAPAFRRYVNLDEYRAQVNPYTGHRWDDDYDFETYRDLNDRGERTEIGTETAHLYWFYNKDLLAGVDAEPPTTWDELVSVCAKLRMAGQLPISTNFASIMPDWVSSTYFDQFHDEWISTVQAQPGDWNWDPELDAKFRYRKDNPRIHATYTYSPQRFYRGLKDRTLRFDTPAMVDLVTGLSRVFPRFASADFFTGTDHYRPFLQGQAAMMVDGSWSLPTLQRDLEELTPERLSELGIEQASVQPFGWDVFEFPPMVSPLARRNVRPTEGTGGASICAVDKDPAHTEMVMDFLMFWLSKPGFTAYTQAQVEAEDFRPSGPTLVAGVPYPKEIEDLFARVEQRGTVAPAYGGFWLNGAGGKSAEDLRSLFLALLQGDVEGEAYAKRVQQYVQRNYSALLRLAHLTDDDVANPSRRPVAV
ncbi:ABC transporter substrate-binding protein [Actinopolymorpha sp. B9G3]|uniref:ABC transporter substrate-binding protein n=1 Tax=Actinopolymorpha sp. B9G3 TaxID=3158970 RepID=UPI0032D99647